MVFSHISPNAQLSGLKKPRRSVNVGSKSSQMAALFVSATFNTDYILMDDHPHLAPQKILIHVQSGNSNYLYGAVCPAMGATQAIIAPHANSEYMYEHLKLISAATAFGHHALLIIDGAGSHQQTLIISRFSSCPLFTGVGSDRAGMAVATSKYVGQLLF